MMAMSYSIRQGGYKRVSASTYTAEGYHGLGCTFRRGFQALKFHPSFLGALGTE